MSDPNGVRTTPDGPAHGGDGRTGADPRSARPPTDEEIERACVRAATTVGGNAFALSWAADAAREVGPGWWAVGDLLDDEEHRAWLILLHPASGAGKLRPTRWVPVHGA